MLLCSGVTDAAHLVNWQLQFLQHCNNFLVSVCCRWRVVVIMVCCTHRYFLSYSVYFHTNLGVSLAAR